MSKTVSPQTEQLDKEWIELIKEAKKMGLSFDEIKQFLLHVNNKRPSHDDPFTLN